MPCVLGGGGALKGSELPNNCVTPLSPALFIPTIIYSHEVDALKMMVKSNHPICKNELSIRVRACMAEVTVRIRFEFIA